MAHLPVEAIGLEFVGAKLGDARRTARLCAIAETIAGAPDASFPKAFDNEASLEAFYRFVGSDAVSFKAVIAPHSDATWKRAAKHPQALVIHDTTTLSFGDARGGRREGLGRINRSDQGMLMHTALVVSDPERRDVLGIGAVRTWTRPDYAAPCAAAKQGCEGSCGARCCGS